MGSDLDSRFPPPAVGGASIENHHHVGTGLGAYTLSYGYNLAGQLNSITNHWGAQVGYVYDKIGRPTNVSGSGYMGVSSYVNSMAYRAFGLKQMAYNNGRTLSLQYDNRLRVTQWNIPSVMGWNYAYQYFGERTGRVTYAQNINDPTLDRSYFSTLRGSETEFFDRLARTFTSAENSGLNQMFYHSGGPVLARDNTRRVLSDIGIKQNLRIPNTDTSGFIRHFVGGLISAGRHGFSGMLMFVGDDLDSTTQG